MNFFFFSAVDEFVARFGLNGDLKAVDATVGCLNGLEIFDFSNSDLSSWTVNDVYMSEPISFDHCSKFCRFVFDAVMFAGTREICVTA